MPEERNGENPDGKARLWPLFVGLPLIAIIAVAAIVFAGGQDGTPRDAAQEREAPGGEQASGGDGAASGGDQLGHPSLGDADAPVVLVEYSDYQ